MSKWINERRVHFATYAPSEVPKWYQPSMEHLPLPVEPELPEALANPPSFGGLGLAYSASDFNAAHFTGTEHEGLAQQHQKALQDWAEQKKHVEAARGQYLYFAWRWFYADEMLKVGQLPTDPPRGGLYV